MSDLLALHGQGLEKLQTRLVSDLPTAAGEADLLLDGCSTPLWLLRFVLAAEARGTVDLELAERLASAYSLIS